MSSTATTRHLYRQMQKPHLYLYRHHNADGSSWAAWACDGDGMIAFGNDPDEAYFAWVAAVMTDTEAAPKGVAVH